PPLIYQTHVAFKGWGEWSEESAVSNPLDKKRNVQAVRINFSLHDVYYSVYWNDKEGWSEETSKGHTAGTTGKSKPITGIKIRLDEAGAKEFTILYRLHKLDGEWTAWAKNGEELFSHGQKLNAIQIKLSSRKK
ncbi:MAG: hypothetical protein IJP68_09805, partial [Selenomonadaceae bacterium]|nr:hypothetical protein [Selenomonadaceae bacterium]